MSSKTHKQADVTRVVKGALKGGMNIGRLEFAEGKIIIYAAEPAPPQSNDLDNWLANHADQA
jgi:hypothetical protein